jgi:hypothetical protein
MEAFPIGVGQAAWHAGRQLRAQTPELVQVLVVDPDPIASDGVKHAGDLVGSAGLAAWRSRQQMAKPGLDDLHFDQIPGVGSSSREGAPRRPARRERRAADFVGL